MLYVNTKKVVLFFYVCVCVCVFTGVGVDGRCVLAEEAPGREEFEEE